MALLVLLKYRLSKVQNQLQKQASGKSDTSKNESQGSKRNSNEGNEENIYEELNITDIVSKHQKQEMGENHYQSLNFSSNSKDSKNASPRKEKSLTDWLISHEQQTAWSKSHKRISVWSNFLQFAPRWFGALFEFFC